MKALPRVNPSDLAYLTGQVWSDAADAVEKSDRLTVASPLTMTETATAKVIGAQAIVRRVLTVEITSQDSDDKSRFSWAESRRNAGDEDWERVNGGRLGTLDDDPCFALDEDSTESLVGQHVCIVRSPIYDDNDNLTDGWLIVGITDFPVRIVGLSQTGGSAGGISTRCNFSYDLFDAADDPEDPDSVPIASGVSMTGNGQRVLLATMNPATWGIAFKLNGSWALIWADETLFQTNCTQTGDDPGFFAM